MTVTREKGWLNYWGSYTFGKALAYNAEDAFDMKRWYAPRPFDRSQILSITSYLHLPDFGTKYLGGHNNVVNGLTNGWKISGYFQAMSGGPMQFGTYNGNEYAVNRNTISIWTEAHLNYQGTVPNFGTAQGLTLSQWAKYSPSSYGAYATGSPDEVAVPVITCDPRKNLAKNQYFNPACFSGPTNLSNGSYRLPYIHGPAYMNDSLGLFKAFAMGGSRKLEVRGETFNLRNHATNEFIEWDPAMYFPASTSWTTSAFPRAATASVTFCRRPSGRLIISAKLQDADGGFYFIVYPATREYESNVLPDQGDSEIVLPKNTAGPPPPRWPRWREIGSSPTFKAAYPAAASNDLAKAVTGWGFLTNAFARDGRNGSYQTITFSAGWA